MTIKELYEWAKERNAENFDLVYNDNQCSGDEFAAFAEIRKETFNGKEYNFVRLDSC